MFKYVTPSAIKRCLGCCGRTAIARHEGRIVRLAQHDLASAACRQNPTERTMRKTRNALLGILTLTSVSGATLAVPAEAAEQYVSRVYKAVPDRSYPYGG